MNVKVSEVVTCSAPVQINSTIIINSHVRRFQSRIGVIELEVIHNQNGSFGGVSGKIKIIYMILSQNNKEWRSIFFLVTNK